MDYEKKYKEALGWMQSLYKWLEGTTKEDAEHYFPELTESEDERIRKELLYWLKSKDGQTLPIDKYNAAIAWLEKQGQVKESLISQQENKMCKENDDSLTNDDEKIRKQLIAVVELYYGETPEQEKKDCLAWLEKQSEEARNIALRTEYEKGRADAITEMQKPVEWSEEDEIRLNHILRLLDVRDEKKYLLAFGLNSLQNLEKDIVWLKSLKDRIGG